MPCHDHYAERPWPRGDDSAVQARAEILSTKLNQSTRLLCSVLKDLEKSGHNLDAFGDPDLVTWWEQHKQDDADREKSAIVSP